MVQRLALLCLACCACATVIRPVPTEAELKERSHAVLDALDRADAPAFKSVVGPAFVQFFSARSYDARFIEKDLEARRERTSMRNTRTWNDERTTMAPGVGVFMGEATVHHPAEADVPAGDLTRWYTLVWVHDGSEWKVEHLQVQAGGLDAERDGWNETFRDSAGFRHQPNQLLIDSVRGRTPGAALDIAMGQGRNALFLAKAGWKVTGVDISDVGLRQAAESAKEQKVALETVQADIDTWSLGTNAWDLVTLIYAGDDLALVDRVKTSVRPGGLFVVEYFHHEATQGTGIGGFETGALAAHFTTGWTVLRDEVVEDTADWGLRKTKLVRFVAQKQ